MTAQIFLFLLFIFSTATSLITEVLKKLLNKPKFPIDIIVLIVASFVGGIGMVFWYILNDVVIGSKDVIFMILMIVANALTAMLGYDKVVEAIKQISGGK